MDVLRAIIGMSLVLASAGVQALTWHTGHLVVSLADKDGHPITNAVVSVRTLNKRYLGVGGKESDYDVTRQSTDTNGVADVAFRFWDRHFKWRVETPSHYSAFFGEKRESFRATVVPSDYEQFSTNTVEGLRMYNELKALEDGGDIEGYYAKFEPKSVTYGSNVVYRSACFYPKVNPAAMYMYGKFRPVQLQKVSTVLSSNGVEIAEFPVVEYDLKKGAVLPPHADPDDVEVGKAGETVDFAISRFCVQTNGVRTYFGTVDFGPGCGAYKCTVTGDASFPSAYRADTNAVFQSSIPYEYSVVGNSGEHVSGRPFLTMNEYMVLRTRAVTNSFGVVTNCHYSKIVGSTWIGKSFRFESTVFNPRPNDPNLEADTEANLSNGWGASARWP